MSLRRFQVFVSVAKHLSITEASRDLHVTQPAISHELKRLEDDLGRTLIRRTTHGIELTEEGVAIRTKLELILSTLSALKAKPASVSPESGEALKLGASHGMSTSLMPLLMGQFKETHPAVNLSLYTDLNRAIEKLLLQGKADLGIATNPRRYPALHSEPFRTARLCVLVPVNHRLANAGEISLKELAAMPLVIRAGKEGGSRTAMLIKRMRDTVGIEPNIVFRCASPDAIKCAVRNGTGVGILVCDAVQDEASRNEFGVLDIRGVRLTARTYILWPKKKPLSKAAEDFLTLLRTWRLKNAQDANGGSILPITRQISDRSEKSGARDWIRPSKLLSAIFAVASLDWINLLLT